MENPNAGRSVKAGPLREPVRVRAELEFTSLLLLRTGACFLGSFVKDKTHGVVSAVTVPGAWADCSVVAEEVENFAARGASRFLVQEGDAEAMLQNRSGEVGIHLSRLNSQLCRDIVLNAFFCQRLQLVYLSLQLAFAARPVHGTLTFSLPQQLRDPIVPVARLHQARVRVSLAQTTSVSLLPAKLLLQGPDAVRGEMRSP